jgi:hypothetical protein
LARTGVRDRIERRWAAWGSALDLEGREGREEEQAVGADLEALASAAVDAGLKVHRTLGPGLLESVYEQCLARELTLRGISVSRQVACLSHTKG